MNKAEADYLEAMAIVCIRRLFQLRAMPEARYAIREWITDLRKARAYEHMCDIGKPHEIDEAGEIYMDAKAALAKAKEVGHE